MSFPPVPPESSPRRSVLPMVLVMVALMVLGVGAGLYGVVRLTLGYRAYVQVSGSMSPTLQRDDRLVVRRADGGEVHRGDLVLIEGRAYAADGFPGVGVVRVVGVAGDTVACCTGEHLSVNGKPITEPYITPGYEGLFEFSAKVPEGTIFVEGDNRGNSDDSRFRGPVQLSGVTGFVVATGTVVTPDPLPAVTAFTDAGLPGAPFTDSTLPTLRWWIVGGFVVFAAGLIGLIVTLARNAGRRRRAAAAPPGH
ncbi:signal peptidase I [Amycolatopsis kentuckyensis]|uniref:signal peptidase I n=1 Tax=Amycolatopsis kentuckyensis TaxID=218823 RepID=UPI001FC9228C|nr:signal peptidase I [Amycolatopsis kentuckyensis]